MALLGKLKKLVSKASDAAEKEADVLEELHPEVQAALTRMYAADAGLKNFLHAAHAYVVFPSVGRAAAVVGGAYGRGEVFKGEELVGYAAIGQLTLGVQLGGETLTQVIAFESKPVFDRFKQGKLAFAANASVALVKAGAAATARYENGAAVFVHSEGGMMLELAIGAQKFVFKPAAIGRLTDKKATKKKAATRKTVKRKAATATRTSRKK
jgi:lipid-binding SYLF domain-containing protein